MAYQEVGNTAVKQEWPDVPTSYPKYSELNGETVVAEGTYAGSHSRPNRFDPTKEDITFYVDCGETKVGLNKAGNLGYLMDKAELNVGDKIRVTYLGMEKIAKGPMAGRPSHSFKLEVDRG